MGCQIKYYLSVIFINSFVTFSSSAQSLEQENYNLFHEWNEWGNGGKMLANHLNKQAFSYLDERDVEIAKLQTKNDWEKRQEKIKKAMSKLIGPFPEKTPLNPRITGIIQKEEFRIEKIIFESMPGYYVTGCLFIPEGLTSNGNTGKRPAILYASGHSVLGYKNPVYQSLILNLVRKGFVVFAFDPIGQGERLQYYDSQKGVSAVGGSTLEHSFPGIQCFLAGASINKYFIWDGIRAIDYLQTREEVDPDRIGITGRSGGGTQSTFIAAFDERIVAAAPENYITSHRRLLESRLPQDAEQNFYHWLVEGVAMEDLLVMRMPKPTLLVATTRDIFSIQGTREVYQEVLKGYIQFNKKGDFMMVEDHAGHASTKSNREAVYRFFQKYLSLKGDSSDEDVDILPSEELNVTTTGQVSTSFGGETAFSLNKKACEKLYIEISKSRQNTKSHLQFVKEKSVELSGYEIHKKETKVVYRGSYQREGYSVGMYALEVESEKYVIPLLLAIPDGEGNHPAVIYIQPESKEEGIAIGGHIEKLVKQGYIVAAPDLLGIGETKSDSKFPAATAFEALQIGKSIVGIQACDIVRVVNFLEELPNVKARQIQAVAFGEQCPALLHAAAYEPSISGVALIESPVSYYNITQTKMYAYSLSFGWGVSGALTAYDLPDLVACIAPRKLLFIDLLNGEKRPASKELITDQMAFPASVYLRRSPGNFKIISTPDFGIDHTLIEWLR